MVAVVQLLSRVTLYGPTDCSKPGPGEWENGAWGVREDSVGDRVRGEGWGSGVWGGVDGGDEDLGHSRGGRPLPALFTPLPFPALTHGVG